MGCLGDDLKCFNSVLIWRWHVTPPPQVNSLSRKSSRRRPVRALRWRSKCGSTSTAFSVCPVPPWLKSIKLMRRRSLWRRSRPTTKTSRFGPANLVFHCGKTGLILLYCSKTCATTVFMVGRICSSEQDADWSGRSAESGRQPKRTWRKDTWEWRNGGKEFLLDF